MDGDAGAGAGDRTQAAGASERAGGIAIHIRDCTLYSKQWQVKLTQPLQSPLLLAQSAFDLFQRSYQWVNPIRSVTIQAINLLPQDVPIQLDLLAETNEIEKMEKIDACVEDLRRRFGNNIIRNAVLPQDIFFLSPRAEITMPTGVFG